jgi:hypothetical protein
MVKPWPKNGPGKVEEEEVEEGSPVIFEAWSCYWILFSSAFMPLSI